MSEQMAYIGREPDGTIMAMAVVNGSPEIRKMVAGWLKDGMDIEQVPLSWVQGNKRLFTKDRYGTPPRASDAPSEETA